MAKHNYQQIIDNALMYGDNIKAYSEYLDYVAYLVKALSLPNNAISEAIILHYLTTRGIVSHNGKIVFDKNISDDIVGFWGMHVVLGEASCRHIAHFANDVMGRNYLLSEPFYCFLSKCDFNNPGNIMINHAISLIIHDGVYYGYDSMQNKLFQFLNGMKLRELYSDNPYFAYYKPEIKMVQNGYHIETIKNDIDLFNSMEKKDIISFDEYSYISNLAKKQIESNRELFDDFRESSKKYTKRITNGIR